MTDPKVFTYKDSGVDVKAGEELVDSIKDMVKETHTSSVLSNIGGFGGFFKPDLGQYERPVFVSSVDGVGTKLLVAFKKGIYHTVGQDLVNHCVNDIAVCGADPLFFLDYFSTGKLSQEIAREVIRGFTIACKQNGCALIGGETAEMPDLYQPGEFDLAGTIVGMVDESSIIDGRDVQQGDIVLGIPSTGLHTNGFSLARKVLFSKYDVNDKVEELDMDVGSALLQIHKSYYPLIKALKSKRGVHAFAHITGGGIVGNTKRVVPKMLKLHIDWKSWEIPALFQLITSLGNVPDGDAREALNLGIGLTIIVDKSHVEEIQTVIQDTGETSYKIGEIK